jgi:hypothetical protein
MYRVHPRLLAAALVATVVFAVPATQAAGRRRAVSNPTATNKVTATKINGTVVDDVTGLPAAGIVVKVGDRSDITDTAGKYEVKNVTSYQGAINVEASRSGYTTKTVRLTTGGEQVVNLRLQPLPTVHVVKANATTIELDFDTIEFGYPVVFSGYNSAISEDFCKPNGTAVTIDRSQIKRIVGPATKTQQGACCGTKEVEKIHVELKSGEVTDLFFVDSCNGVPSIDFIGANHTSGRVEYTPFTAITEIVFP